MNNKYSYKITYPILIGISIIVISFFYFSFTSNDKAAGLIGDDTIYLLQAELYSPWKKEISPAAEHIRTISFFPPLYPIVLGIFGADSQNLAFASNITVTCLLLSLFFIGYFAHSLTQSKTVAIILPIFIAFLPKTLLFSQDLYSEFLFMCLIYIAFSIMNDDELTSRHWLMAALIISLTSLTRSIGIGLALAFVILLCIKRPRFYLCYIFISCMPFFTWMLNRYIFAGEHNYINHLFDISNQAYSFNIIELLQQKLIVYAKTWESLFYNYSSGNIFTHLLIGLFFILSFFGFFLRLNKLKIDAIFLPIYLFILAIWPYNDLFLTTRFLYPLFPLLLLYIVIAIQKLHFIKKYQNTSCILLFSLMFIMASPTSAQYIKRGFIDIDDNLKPYTRTGSWLNLKSYDNAYRSASLIKEIAESLPNISNHVPKHECIYASHTSLVTLYAQYISIQTPTFNDSLEEFESRALTCNYFIAMPISGEMINHPIYYPLNIIINNPKYKIIPLLSISKNRDKAALILIKRIVENS